MSMGKILFVWCWFLLTSGVIGGCPNGWIQRDSFCYFFNEGARNWANAKKYCNQKGADLASIHSQAENQFITRNILTGTGSYGPLYYIGFNDIVKDKTFVWSDKTKVTFTGWNDHEPNGGTRENCGHVYYRADKRKAVWNDIPCNRKFYFICKKGTLPTWFRLPPIHLGKLPAVSGTTQKYSVPGKVPYLATDVLLFVNIHSKYNPGHNTQGKFEIFTKEGQHRYSKYMAVFLFKGMHTTSSSQNLWLPLTPDRKVSVRYTGPEARRHLFGDLYVTGYRA